MDAFLVPRAATPLARTARLAAQEELAASRAAEASRIGLPWPPPQGKRRRGAPSRQEYYDLALYECIRKGTLPVDLTSRDVLAAWSCGDLVMGRTATVEATLMVASEVPVESEVATQPRQTARPRLGPMS